MKTPGLVIIIFKKKIERLFKQKAVLYLGWGGGFEQLEFFFFANLLEHFQILL